MVKLRRFDDIDETRRSIYRNIKNAFETSFPREGRNVKLEIKDVEIPEGKRISKSDQKKHILFDRDLTVPVKGTMVLTDKASGKKLDQKRMTLGQLPYLSKDRMAFIGGGSEFHPANQMRLQPGAYTRIKENDEVETQFNVEGKMGFRVNMDPKSGVFRVISKGNKLRLFPLLKDLGVSEKQMQSAWGKKLLDANRKDDNSALDRLYNNLAGFKAEKDISRKEKADYVKSEMKNLRMDKEINMNNLGMPYSNVTPGAFLDSTKKILRVYNGSEDPDNRDSIEAKSFWGVEDFVEERIRKDAGGLSKKLMYQLDKQKKLDKVLPSYFSKQLKQVVKNDDRVYPADQVNPISSYDAQHKVIVTGEGGVGSIDLITPNARNVDASQFGFIDPIRGPENERIGIETRLALNTFKGDDRTIYAEFKDPKTGKKVYLNPKQARRKTIAFPNELKRKRPYVIAMKDGKQKYVRRSSIDLELEKPEEMNSPYLNLVPFASAVSGNRSLMAGKAMPDTMPLTNPEAPFVRVKTPDGSEAPDFETLYGRKALAEVSPISGVVDKVTQDKIVLKDGSTKHEIDLFKNYPASQKTFLDNYATVKPGDKVRKGQVVARTNFSNDEGAIAVGKHPLTAFMPYKGLTFEDGIVISESAKDLFETENLRKIEVPLDDITTVNKKKFIAQFPTIFGKDATDKVDENGVVKPGTILKKGDPVVLATRKKQLSAEDIALGKIHKALKNIEEDSSEAWDTDEDGVVTDVAITGKKAKVYVKYKSKAKVGDKLTGRFGNKGVISAILPDNEMPKVKRTGDRIQMILNPLGVVSRTNPGQIFEGLLGKVAKEKGKVFRVPSFVPGSYVDDTEKILKENNIPDREALEDDQGNQSNALVVAPYFYKLSKSSKGAFNARNFGAYTSDMQPAKSKVHGNAIKVGTMELSALLGHGAKANLREIATIKGEKNQDFWRNLKLGYPLPEPGVPFVYDKFLAMVKASGGNVEKKGDFINISPLTDKETRRMSQGEVRNSKFLKAKDMSPEPGGFFDMGLTGGVSGKNWTHISLSDPMPSPMMEQPIKSILGMKGNDFDDVLSGKKKLNDKFGGKAFREALKKINVDDEIAKEESNIKTAPKSKKNDHVKRLMYLKGLKKTNTKPEELVVNYVPVLPPVFRPISATSGADSTVVVSDPNLMYRDLMHANSALTDLKKDLPEEDLGDERLNLYNTFAATVGTRPHVNVEFEKTSVKPFIKKIVGDKPKTGFFFDKMVAKSQDLVGRGVAVPDSTLSIDEVGLPEDMIFKQMEPFIIKDLVQKGFPATRAPEEIKERTQAAYDSMNKVIQERPVMINRAPTLHKYNVMGAWARPHKHKGIAVNPMIEAPFNLDHDGDAMQVHVPVTEEARKEVIEKMLPSKNLQAVQDHNVHYIPRQEDNYGLWLASTKDKKNKPIKVSSPQELDALIKSRKIAYDDRIEFDDETW